MFNNSEAGAAAFPSTYSNSLILVAALQPQKQGLSISDLPWKALKSVAAASAATAELLAAGKKALRFLRSLRMWRIILQHSAKYANFSFRKEKSQNWIVQLWKRISMNEHFIQCDVSRLFFYRCGCHNLYVITMNNKYECQVLLLSSYTPIY